MLGRKASKVQERKYDGDNIGFLGRSMVCHLFLSNILCLGCIANYNKWHPLSRGCGFRSISASVRMNDSARTKDWIC